MILQALIAILACCWINQHREQPFQGLGFNLLLHPQVWLRDPIGQYTGILDTREGGHYGQRRGVHLVPSRLATRQPTGSRVPPQRDPPSGKCPELTIVPRRHGRGRGMSV